MALREIIALVQANFSILATTQLHAGQYVALDATSNIVAADRAMGAGAMRGILADDTARTGNTMIIPDPVGANYLDSGGNFIANNNGLYAAQKRALGDYQAEDVTNVTDLTSGNSGFQGPRRGVGVYTSPSTILIIDSICFTLYKTNDTLTSPAYQDIAFTGGDTFLPNDLLTPGTGANAGKLVKVYSASASLGSLGKSVARVDSYDSAGGMLQITLL